MRTTLELDDALVSEARCPRHSEYRSWLTERLAADEAFGISDLVLSGFLRVANAS
ncbi:MAG: hypothetical protein H0V92_09335 [Pseudonocardiales bacterium]|nr:hypothetical protein [Pseudonocardiales bacterium]